MTKCSKCGRRLGKTFDARMRHYERYHAAELCRMAGRLVLDIVRHVPALQSFGAHLGQVVKRGR